MVHTPLPVELFRGHILRRADGQPGAGERWRLTWAVCFDLAGDAKVGEEGSVLAEEDVIGLDIAVNQPQRVDGGKRRGDLHPDGDGVGWVKALAAIEDIAQGAVEQGHDEVEVGSFFAVALDGHDVGVGELADKRGLVLEARDVLGVGGEGWWENFDRDVVVGRRIAPTVDLGHAADVE
jgi:hypothetical protein